MQVLLRLKISAENEIIYLLEQEEVHTRLQRASALHED